MHEISIVIWDGTSYFVEDDDYILNEGEEMIFRGIYYDCCEIADGRQIQLMNKRN